MNTLWKYTFRQIRQRPGRALLTLLGITIGVATIVAISATTKAAHRAYREMFDAVGGEAQLEVTSEGGSGFDPSQVEFLRNDPAVKRTVAVIHTHAGVKTARGPQMVLTLGLDVQSDDNSTTYKVVHGRGLQDDDEALLGQQFAQEQSIDVNQIVELITASGASKVKIVGLIDSSGLGVFDGGAVMLLPLNTAQTLFRMKNQVNTVQIVLKENVNKDQAKRTLAKKIPKGLRVQEPFARGMLAEEGLLSTEMALDGLSVVSLIGGAFVILNSFLMNLGERRRQLAILRALGTTRSQIMRLLLREAVFMGVVGTALGLGLGVVLAQGLISLQEQLLYVDLPPLKLTFEPFLLGLIVGPGMSLAATWIPTRRAGSRPPLEAMMPRRSVPQETTRLWPRIVGLILVLLALCSVFAITNKWWSGPSAKVLLGPTTSLMLIGCVLLLPVFLPGLQKLVTLILQPILGAEGKLAFRQMERQHTRTALTVGVLFIGLIITVGFGSTLLDSIGDINTWYDETVHADYLVRGLMPKPSTLSAVEMPEELGDQLAKIEGVAHVGKLNFIIPVWLGGQPTLMLARTFAPNQPLGLAIVHGNEQEIREGLRRGEIVLGTTLAHRINLNIGDQVVLNAADGPTQVKVCGIVKEYTVGGMAFYLDWEHGQSLMDFKGIHTFEISAESEAADEVYQRLKQFTNKNNLIIQSNNQLRKLVDQNVSAVVGFLWCLIALMFVVASLGIVNTLTMNILEQTRELGVLRAIGLKRGQLRRLVLAQAIGLAFLSIVPGVIVGLALSWITNMTTPALSGHELSFQFHPLFVAMCCLIALIVSFVAALLPARRASQINVIESLQYE